MVEWKNETSNFPNHDFLGPVIVGGGISVGYQFNQSVKRWASGHISDVYSDLHLYFIYIVATSATSRNSLSIVPIIFGYGGQERQNTPPPTTIDIYHDSTQLCAYLPHISKLNWSVRVQRHCTHYRY